MEKRVGKMKIALVSSYCPPHVCGIGIYAAGLAKAWRKQGHEVCVFAKKGYDYGKEAEAAIGKSFWDYWETAGKIIEGKYGAVFIEHEYSVYNPAWFLVFLARLKAAGVKTAVDYHTIAPEKHWALAPLFAAFHSVASRLAGKNIVHTNLAKGRLAKFSLLGGKIERVPLAVGEEKLARKAIGKPPKLLCFGFVSRDKGFDLAAEATNGETWHLTIAGTVYDDAKKRHLEYLEELKGKTNGVKNIRFINRRISEEEKKAMFREADLVLLPYRFIEQSAVLAEAWAFGKIPVCSDIPAFREEIGNNERGVLFKNGDAQDLKRQIRGILRDKEKRNVILEAVERARKDRGFGKISEKYLEVAKNGTA